MSAPPQYFRETHLIGPACREHMISSEYFPVLRNAPFAWIGYSVLYNPYRMVRFHSVHSHIVAAISGSGRTLIGGRVADFKPGQVLLGPVGAYHAFEIQGRGPWRIAWVFFGDDIRAPVLRGRDAQLIDADASDFVSIIQMLLREAAGAAQPAAMSALVTLLDTSARRIAGTDKVDLRLWRLWEKVEGDLAADWTMAKLGRLASMSEEHLRRLCHRHYQRSPMEHLTHLRMQRAGMMLRSYPEKVDTIAQLVGYASMYSFSTAFRRWSGMAPTHFRRKGR